MLVGILALQGDFTEHSRTINLIDEDYILIKNSKQLKGIKALILPGGESSSMNIIQKNEDLFTSIKSLIQSGIPTLGTCAGAILLADNIINDERINLNLLNITIERNAYGRQNESFEAYVGIEDMEKEKVCFIRAPKITNVGENVSIISKLNNDIVGVRQDNIVAYTFHPELSPSPNYLTWLKNFIYIGANDVRSL
ncbi:MAG: pyridoxal 5'-phosphate synthase glutaminase subunit PdxT [Actinomycetota bacterium]|nr:pyridoxal 5'-phosphate synthase glutaminase subunit PdxT [Actinomycetota bacterium]